MLLCRSTVALLADVVITQSLYAFNRSNSSLFVSTCVEPSSTFFKAFTWARVVPHLKILKSKVFSHPGLFHTRFSTSLIFQCFLRLYEFRASL